MKIKGLKFTITLIKINVKYETQQLNKIYIQYQISTTPIPKSLDKIITTNFIGKQKKFEMNMKKTEATTHLF